MSLFAIRKGERRQVWASFLTLFALIASHSVLETARDALFLAKVPVTRLPWVVRNTREIELLPPVSAPLLLVTAGMSVARPKAVRVVGTVFIA